MGTDSIRVYALILMVAGCGGVESIVSDRDAGSGDGAVCQPSGTLDVCNARDDDCDGLIDEDFVPNPPDFTRDPGLFESNWYIGDLLVDWRSTPPAVTCPAAALAFEGSSTWSDPETGGLLYYTNGLQLFDAAGVLVPNGDQLAGVATATETSLFAPVPGPTSRSSSSSSMTRRRSSSRDSSRPARSISRARTPRSRPTPARRSAPSRTGPAACGSRS